jgi:alpha-D-xyloside xylohydrolase
VTQVSVARHGDRLLIRCEGVKRALPLVLRQTRSLQDTGGLLEQSGELGVSLTLPAGDGEFSVRL